MRERGSAIMNAVENTLKNTHCAYGASHMASRGSILDIIKFPAPPPHIRGDTLDGGCPFRREAWGSLPAQVDRAINPPFCVHFVFAPTPVPDGVSIEGLVGFVRFVVQGSEVIGPRRARRARTGSRKDAGKGVVVFLCGFAPLREIVFQSYRGWDGEGFAQRR